MHLRDGFVLVHHHQGQAVAFFDMPGCVLRLVAQIYDQEVRFAGYTDLVDSNTCNCTSCIIDLANRCCCSLSTTATLSHRHQAKDALLRFLFRSLICCNRLLIRLKHRYQFCCGDTVKVLIAPLCYLFVTEGLDLGGCAAR